ncbi:MAG TPA: hypothetical protein VFN26_18895 [Candidatus Acidoferrum sp.]|nr:hypothetical protein [Candidatus Acidoferrum sp.]
MESEQGEERENDKAICRWTAAVSSKEDSGYLPRVSRMEPPHVRQCLVKVTGFVPMYSKGMIKYPTTCCYQEKEEGKGSEPLPEAFD